MRTSLLKLQAMLGQLGTELDAANENVVALASNGAASMDAITEATAARDAIKTRFDLVKDEHDRAQLEAEAAIRATEAETVISTGDRIVAAKAAFFRAVLTKQPISDDIRAQLQAIPADGGSGGENFLPTTLSDELIHEPFATNPLRNIAPVTQVRGLELPRIAFEVDDDSFIGDDDTAAELEMTGDKVSFGRNKTKVKARVSDTVLLGSDVQLVSTIENALRSGLAAKEKKTAFAAVLDQVLGEEHMSFYQEVEGDTAIKEVTGTSKFKAIKNAIADLPDAFRENAKVVMTYADYVDILEDLANGSTPLYSAQPEQILGKPVEFCDSATTPIVGDFNYFRINYDIPPTYDTDKDVDAGEYIFVLTGWFDEKRLLNSAFRLAVVEPEVGEG